MAGETTRQLRVLLVEDSEDDALLVERMLRSAGLKLECRRVETAGALDAALTEAWADLILSDYTLPGYNGLAALEAAQQIRPDIPFVFVSGTIGEERAAEAMRLGASDYVIKDRLSRLPHAVQQALELSAERRKRRASDDAVYSAKEALELANVALTETNDALERSQARYRLLAERSPFGIVLSRHGHVAYANPAALVLLRARKASEVLGRDTVALFDDADRETVRGWLLAEVPHAPSPFPVTVEVRVQRDDGTVADAQLATAPFEDEDGPAVQLLLRDVTAEKQAETERRRLEESLRRSELLSALGELVGAVAHEVRNPLFGISATLQALEARHGVDSSSRPYVDLLRGEVDRINGLMSDLLAYGRPRPKGNTVCQLGPALNEAVRASETLAREHVANLEVHLLAEGAVVPFDESGISRVFRNLIDNAIRHAPAGSTVRVTVRAVDSSWLECTVEDDGPGFQPEDLPHVFEPFHSKRVGGTGLGLAIVERTVRAQGGDVRAANRAEGGAVVTVRLPRADVPRP